MGRLLKVACAWLAIAWLLAGCGGSSEIARVGPGTITSSELSHWQAIANSLGPTRPAPDSLAALSIDPPASATSRQWALSYLIAQRQIAAEAAQRDIEVSPDQARRALEVLRYETPFSRNAANSQRQRLKALLASSSESEADRIQLVKGQLLAARIQASLYGEALRALPQPLLAAYYKAHRKRFITPERRNVYAVESFTKRNAEEARREIEAGQTIGNVVKRRDEEPQVGGAKRGLTRASLTHPYEQNYFKAKLHELVGPLKAQIYYLFYVSNIQPRRVWSLHEEELQVRQALIAGSRHYVLSDLTQGVQRTWQAQTRCAAAYLVAQCGGRL
jgi:hypothetical protein